MVDLNDDEIDDDEKQTDAALWWARIIGVVEAGVILALVVWKIFY